MATAKKRCRVCGKEYEACRSAKREVGVFRWQEVACSPECGAIYLRKIEESRGIRQPKKDRHKKASAPVLQVPDAAVVEPAQEAGLVQDEPAEATAVMEQ